jgi:tetratricopeptide (TPR) repeat protein
VLERLERFGEAIEQYKLAVAVHESYLDARIAMAFALLRAGADEEAGEAFAQAMDLKIRKIREPYEKGVQRLREGMLSEARSSSTRPSAPTPSASRSTTTPPSIS